MQNTDRYTSKIQDVIKKTKKNVKQPKYRTLNKQKNIGLYTSKIQDVIQKIHNVVQEKSRTLLKQNPERYTSKQQKVVQETSEQYTSKT